MERVLFLIKAHEFGGLEIVLLDWLSRVEYSETSVVLCCYANDLLAQKLAASGLPIETVRLMMPDSEPLWRSLPRWRRLMSSIRPDKVVLLEGRIGEFDLPPVLASWWASRNGFYLFEANWGRPVAVSPSGTKRKLHYGFIPGIGWYRHKEVLKQRLRGKLARHTFVVSRGIKDNLVASYGYPASRTSVLYHGVDTRRFHPSPVQRREYRRAYGIPEDATVIVSHGRLAPRKRVDRILNAFALLSGEHQNLWLLLTAYGPLKEEVERTVASSDAYRRVKLLGFQEDSSRMLQASDIYVLASDDEGFGLALVEALATGLVCVATNGPGPADILVDGGNGFLVGATYGEVLAGLRRALSLGGSGRARLVDRARTTVDSRFEINTAIRGALDAMQIPARWPS